ncbi:MAG: phenylacetate--CoA ligase [Lentisphaerae bacterium GWF2_44_16]|nr:MAG: phenylacetate--CoA ligase [Lentisphaerae bacterium GWF2_44_16]
MWNIKCENMEHLELKNLQSERLSNLIEKLYRKVAFYRKKMDDAKVSPSDIKDISDIRKLPFTSKQEVLDLYPYGLLCADMKDVVEIHMSSGTTGRPVVGAYTANDIELWGEAMARTLSMGGVNSEDIVQNAYGYGLFTGGMGAHYGAGKIGATVIPISGGNTKRQLTVMKDFKSTVLTCTPSYSLYLAETAAEHGFKMKDMALKAGFFGAEPWSENMRREIQERLHVKAYDIYGLTEIIGPGVASECEAQDGLHIQEDLFYPEIIDPVTGEVLLDGEKGELVITTLTREGTPIIRYRTRDITYFLTGKCSCERTLRRIHRLLGRNDDMLIIRGVNIFPSQIEHVLFNIEGVEPHYQLLVDRKAQLDYLEVQVEVNESIFSDEIRKLEGLEKDIEKELYSALGIHTKVKLVEPKSIARSEGKAKRIIDKRSI